ncbi:hypothetical protein E4U17_006649 [Claviceps sp. LM77 group G4]|nr:hypothetical protein E4U17_006649 [Claviceps sp. LM77 group G4]KAG6062317.1 hypothetical protein E4U33_006569 [Claviceps sp. LM78 group G4]KAG6070939.1 hypothetical protein E4U16_006490 [Claviceps sp. LM84 group G4]
MDTQRLIQTIKENPVAPGLDLLHSEARRNGVRDIAVIDRLSEYDVKILALQLLVCWRIYAKVRVKYGIHGSVLNERDVITVFDALVADSIEQDFLRRLLKIAIPNPDEEIMWDEFSTLAVTLKFEKVVIAEQLPEMVLGDRPTGSSS